MENAKNNLMNHFVSFGITFKLYRRGSGKDLAT